MRSIRVTSFLLAFACTLALVGCQHTASKTTQSNQGAGSQAQAASAQAERANAQTQPANVPAQSASNSDQSAAGSGSARLAPPARPTQAAAPEPPAQGCPSDSPRPVHSAQSKSSGRDRGLRQPRRESAAPSDHSRWHAGRDSSDTIPGLSPQCNGPELRGYLGCSHRGG